jgi:hypothetical protein
MSDTNPPQRVCPQCRKQVDLTTRFCKYCAFELPPPAKTVEGRFETVSPVPQSTTIRSFLIFIAVIAFLGLAIYVVNTREEVKKNTANMTISSPTFPANNDSSDIGGYQPTSNSAGITAAQPMPPSAGTKRGELITDSNLRSEPNKDAYSVAIHFNNAKFEILDETSYEINGQISNWYKVRIFEYGCSKDAAKGCGKNTPYDADEGWVNGKNIIRDGVVPNNQRAEPERNLPEKSARYVVRVYNVDDFVVVYVNNSQILRVEYSKTGEIDITDKLKPGNNDVRFLVMNTGGGYTYGIEILEDGRSYFRDDCGKVRSQGCAGESSRQGNVFDHTVSIPLK